VRRARLDWLGVAVYADLFRYRELFGSLFRRDLQARYRGSLLGIVWTLVNPLVLLGIYLLVFSVLSRFIAVDHPALFLLSGLTVWVFFSTALHTASRSMLDNANLIRKTRFPRQLVPLSVVATHLVTFAVMLAVLLALNFAFLPRVRATEWLAIPLSVALVGLVGGLALALASANVLFRDVEHLVGALLLPWFFLTPILWVPSAFESHEGLVEVLHWVNFATPAVHAIRDPLFFGELPRAGDVIYLCASAVVALVLGAFLFSRVDDRIAVEL
jgi:lipopolysaccharide transport system permease protein